MLTKEQKEIVIKKWANEELEKIGFEIFYQQCMDMILFSKKECYPKKII
jgi:hypothetical protein